MLLATFYLIVLGALLVFLVNLKRPTNDRPWRADLVRPPKIDFDGDKVLVHDVRNIRYGAPGTPFVGRWDDREYDLSKLERVWFVVESFSKIEAIAHTFVSFEFEGGDYLAFSAEARVLQGEPYDILRGMFNNFELIYTLGDERDFYLAARRVSRSRRLSLPADDALPPKPVKCSATCFMKPTSCASSPAFITPSAATAPICWAFTPTTRGPVHLVGGGPNRSYPAFPTGSSTAEAGLTRRCRSKRFEIFTTSKRSRKNITTTPMCPKRCVKGF